MTCHQPVPTLGLLPCLADWHVHAVYNPTEAYPLAVCGLRIVPGIHLDGQPLLCRRCLTRRHRHTQLRPAADQHRHHLATQDDQYRRLLAELRHGIAELERRRLARRYDRRIRHAIAHR